MQKLRKNNNYCITLVRFHNRESTLYPDIIETPEYDFSKKISAHMTIAMEEVLKPFSVQAKGLAEGAIYEHYKGKRYRILCVGRNSETLEENVVYQAQYGDKDIWVRPLSMFLENVTLNGQVQPRFQHIE